MLNVSSCSIAGAAGASAVAAAAATAAAVTNMLVGEMHSEK
jgi:hypothetical protein